MDRTEEDMKLVGFFGIFKQSFKTIFSSKKIFAQITLAFILPLAIIFIIQMEISHRFFWRIDNNSLPYDTNGSRKAIAIDWLYYALFQFVYFIFLTIFSLLSTAMVVFTIASIYTTREVIFRNVMKVIPKVWKRLCVTFIFIYIAQFIFDVIGGVALAIIGVIFVYSGIVGAVVFIIILILYVYGFLYLSVVCQLASVVTVLENIHGFNALKKGKVLANGKKKVGMGIAFVLYGILLGLIYVYKWFVQYGDDISGLGLIWRVLIGILCGVLLMKLFLVFIVTQMVLYLVCKSYHREAIDKLSLLTFLEAYMGETVVYPGPGEEIQLGRPRPPSEQV
ncbi:hypothetical protein HanXRQr2_Chr05g0235271 [Helianthus annuus]|uniref:Polyadenylate-binding protein 1-B-binding protein n=1 Tax=Helianthus annuus TaxID=4232 RepID=A0A251UU75_HELAN|nr:uncharacterized protein LOC110944104 [Helianthus annuus]KAF5807581.1 hypothetical protein HanXRQr2_Chr05g0235271 [Helianthus annuus]